MNLIEQIKEAITQLQIIANLDLRGIVIDIEDEQNRKHAMHLSTNLSDPTKRYIQVFDLGFSEEWRTIELIEYWINKWDIDQNKLLTALEEELLRRL